MLLIFNATVLLKADDNGNDVVESGKESTQKSPALSLKFLSMGSNPPPPSWDANDHIQSLRSYTFDLGKKFLYSMQNEIKNPLCDKKNEEWSNLE